MHIPHHFKNENLDEVRTFVKANSFGILVSTVENKPWGTHIPLELELDTEGNEVLYGHIAKANPQGRFFQNQKEVLAIFNGPHAYVSSSWYGHENVPTWNYIAVHIYGKLEVLDEAETLFSLKLLVDKYEAHSKNPVRVEDLSAKTMRQIKGIIGFKINITDIQAAYKLSQNRNADDHQRIVSELRQSNNAAAQATANEMKK